MQFAIIVLFVLGYLAIALERPLRLNKAASALVTGVLCWTIYILSNQDRAHISLLLVEHVGEISGILFFLLGAMTIVELIDGHDGFDIISARIRTRSKVKLLWIVGFLSFFLSAFLDNLTTSIVMVSLMNKLMTARKDKLFFAGLVVIAANAGGAWSPIGDVTTTMLWIGGQITTVNVILKVILPSLACLLTPLVVMSFTLKGEFQRPIAAAEQRHFPVTNWEKNLVFSFGILSLLFVPVFKAITHLPPFMGMLLSLGLMWIFTEFIHHRIDEGDKGRFSVKNALQKIDSPSILFFLGILVSVSALQTIGTLTQVAKWLNHILPNENVVVIVMGLLSAVIDNVPLVAGIQGMYTLEQYSTDHTFWHFIAYCTGTGGSALIIGSAAGIVAMGILKIDFIWYLKNISLWALAGYFAGAGVFLLQQWLVG